MKATKRSQYALRAMLFLLKEDCCSLRIIAEKEGISFDYLEKIFSKLEKKGLLISKRGSAGGYSLASKNITLKDIFAALEEPLFVVDCIEKSCPRDGKCKASVAWKKVNKTMERALSSIKLSDL